MKNNLYKQNKWKVRSARFRKQNPLCKYCQIAGRKKASRVTDHIKPHKGNLELFWDENNWQALCFECHNEVKKREEHGYESIKGFGFDGYPIL